jgi:hypothetical protein
MRCSCRTCSDTRRRIRTPAWSAATRGYPATVLSCSYYFWSGLWIRIRIGSRFSDIVDLDPYWESRSRGKKIKKFQWKNAAVFLIWFDSNFDFNKIWKINCLPKFCFSLGPDP